MRRGSVVMKPPIHRSYLQSAHCSLGREEGWRWGSEVEKILSDTGFADQTWGQTMLKPFDEIQEIEPIRSDRGQGTFVVVRSTRL